MDTVLREVNTSVAVALDCVAWRHDEATWNSVVHCPLVDLTIGREANNLAGFTPWYILRSPTNLYQRNIY